MISFAKGVPKTTKITYIFIFVNITREFIFQTRVKKEIHGKILDKKKQNGAKKMLKKFSTISN